MNCDIYKSLSLKGAYVFVASGSKVEEKLPSEILEKIGELSFLKSIIIEESAPLIGVDPNEVMQNISKRGFHLQGVKIKADVISEAGAAIGAGILAASLGLGPIGAIMGAAAGFLLANASKGGGKE